MIKTRLSQYLMGLLFVFGLSMVACLDASAPPVSEPNEADANLPDFDLPIAEPDAMIDEPLLMPDADLRQPIEVPIQAAEVVVKLNSEQTIAGELNRVSCLVYGEHGQVLPYDSAWGTPRYDIRPLEGWTWENEEEGIIIANHAQPYQVKCIIPSLGLRSDSRPWLVKPADIQELITRSEQAVYVAGEEQALRCEAYDRFGNEINNLDGFEWRSQPPVEQIETNTDSALNPLITQAGEYEFTCTHPDRPGANLSPVEVSVVAAQPQELNVFLASGRQVFSIGEIVQVRHELYDAYGNRVLGIPVQRTLTPQLPSFGEGNYQASQPGQYEVTVSVEPQAQRDQPVAPQSVSFQVEDGAPQIRCLSPQLGAMVGLSAQEVRGQVDELSSLESFTVNGRMVSVDSNGAFSSQVTPTWGLNIVELVAQDQFGNQSVQHCMFFASNVYLPESSSITDVALLHLDQDAIDDGAPRSPINSLGDLLGQVLNSSQLISTINQNLTNLNPIVPVVCRANTFLGCAFSAGVTYNSTRVNGPNSISLNLTTGGVNLDATLRGLSLNVTASGRVTGVSWSQTGSVALSSIRVQAKLGISLSGSTPQVQIVGTPTVTLGNITLSLNIGVSVVQSVLNAFLNLVLDAFEGIIRNQISDVIESFITTEVDTILSSALNSLDFDALGLNLNLPRPLGGGNYQLGLSFSLNRLNVNSNRMQIGMKSLVSGLRLNTRSSSGVASPSGSRLVELNPGFSKDAAGALHISLLNSVLHRLWRGRYFEVSQVPEGFGQGIDLSFSLLTPPAMELTGTRQALRLHLGPAQVQLNMPAFLSEELNLVIGAYATSSVSVNSANELVFAPISIDDLVLSSPDIPLSAESLEAIEDLMSAVIQDLLNDALNEALPVFPIPEFVLPNSLSIYGVPRGTTLSVEGLTLSNDSNRLIVKGNLR